MGPPFFFFNRPSGCVGVSFVVNRLQSETDGYIANLDAVRSINIPTDLCVAFL